MNSHQDITEAIKLAKNPLIVTHESADGDAVGATLAMFLFLVRLGRNPTAVIDKAVPEAFGFLPGADKITSNDFFPRELVIHLDAANAEINSVKWSRDEDKKSVKIVVTPRVGSFEAKGVSFSDGGSKFDAILILDDATIPRLGKVYEKNQDLFQGLQTVNIDHHPDNPLFGKLNLVESKKSSTSEILYNLFVEIEQEMGQNLIDADIATCLLAGIIADTGSFQYPATTPDTLQVAAKLIGLGGRREEVIKNIYHTRRLTALHLWGRALAKMKVDRQARIAWSTVTKEDMTWSQAEMDDRKGLINDLMANVAEADLIVLITEDDDGARASVRTKNGNRRAAEFAALFNGGGHETAAGFHIAGKSLEEAEKEIVARAVDMQKIVSENVLSVEKDIPAVKNAEGEKSKVVEDLSDFVGKENIDEDADTVRSGITGEFLERLEQKSEDEVDLAKNDESMDIFDSFGLNPMADVSLADKQKQEEGSDFLKSVPEPKEKEMVFNNSSVQDNVNAPFLDVLGSDKNSESEVIVPDDPVKKQDAEPLHDAGDKSFAELLGIKPVSSNEDPIV
ncbi:MAG: DHH family phosphoesterase [Patescibacteria group bacterium]|nr:DHH family phosphoesterase [Patescibacteria group bacterium]